MDQIRIGKFIQVLRKGKNLTQAELANKLGVSDRAVSKWENGRGLPDYEYVQDLCKELEISFNEFMAGERIEDKDTETKLEENLTAAYKDSIKGEKTIIQDKNYIYSHYDNYLDLNFDVYNRRSSNEKR